MLDYVCTNLGVRHRIDGQLLGGTKYLSDATSLIRPHLLYALFIVSRTIVIGYILRDV